MDPTVITVVLSVVALFVASLTLLASWKQARTNSAVASLAGHSARLHEIETIHAGQIADLEHRLSGLQEDNRRHQRHVDHCEEELERIKQLLTARG